MHYTCLMNQPKGNPSRLSTEQVVWCTHMTITALTTCAALLIGTAISTASPAIAQSKVIPPSQWFNKPEYSPDGSMIAVASPPPGILKDNDTNAKLYDDKYVPPRRKILIVNAKDFTLITEIESEVWPAWSPNSKYICVNDFGTQCLPPHRMLELGLYDAGNGVKLMSIADAPLGSYSWSPDSKRLFLTHREAVSILDIEKKQEISLPLEANENHFRWPQWSPDGTLIAASLRINLKGERKNAIKIWNSTSKEENAKITVPAGNGMFSWSPNGKLFIYREPLAIHILDADSRKEIKSIKTKKTEAVYFDWSHDKRKFSYQDDNVFHILDSETMNETARIAAPTGGYMNIEWSANDSFILISAQNTAAICDAESGKYIGYKTWPDAVRHTLSADQKLVFVQTFAGQIESEAVTLPPAQGKSPFIGGTIGEPCWDESDSHKGR